MSNALALAARHARRPLLLTPDAATELAHRVREVDVRAFARPSGFRAALRALGSVSRRALDAAGVAAMEDDHDYAPVPLEERLAYSPLYIGEPDDLGFCWTLKDGVALMCADTPLTDRGEEFCGVVYHGYDTLLAGLREAQADERVGGVFLRLNSPGGVVAGGLPALAQFMRETRAAAGGKPIHVYADAACSAAYWIAAQADRISAPGVGYVGSIGAVWVHEDYSAALGKAGVVVTPIQFGARKTEGAPWAALSAEAAASIQADVDQCGRDFIAEVVAGRPQLTAEALLATQAAVYMAGHDDPARSGLALGFVDAIESEEEAFAALLETISAPLKAQTATTTSQEAAMFGRSPRAAAPAVRKPAQAAAKPAAQPPVRTRRASAADPAVVEPAPAPDDAAEDAAEGVIDCPTCDGTGQVWGKGGEDLLDCPTCDGSGDIPADSPAGKEEAGDEGDAPPADAPPPTAPAQTGARSAARAPAAQRDGSHAILSSTEAKTHPHLAIAAARDGLTLAQFKGQVAALADQPRASRLDAAMAGARRLGPDAASGAAGSERPSALAARAEARRKARG